MTDKLRFKTRIYFLVFIVFLGTASLALSAPQGKPGDLSNHPVYSGYPFGSDEKVIDFATQPLAAPLGVIVEAMKRDRILRGQLKSKGKELRFHAFLKGADGNYFMKRGLVEIAVTGDTPVITLAATYDLVIPALVKQGHTSLIAKRQMQISELKGRRIGYSFGSTAHYGLLIALYASKLKESDVVLVPLEIDELSEALERDRVDAITAWEPIPMALLAKHPEYAILQQFINTNYLCLTRAFAKRHPEETSWLLASFVRALRWMKRDEKNLLRAAAWNMKDREKFQNKPSDVTLEQLATITRSQALPLSDAPYIPLKDLKDDGMFFKSFEFLKSQGVIVASAPWDKIKASLDRKMLAEVLSRPVKYKLDKFDYDPGNGLK
jgi:ABC-type nitrate/sulfonate/bicarbonate transport system substrate-binding protein